MTRRCHRVNRSHNRPVRQHKHPPTTLEECVSEANFLKPSQQTPSLFEMQPPARAVDRPGPSVGGSSLSSDWSYLVARPCVKRRWQTIYSRSVRPRDARALPALTGVHPLARRGAFEHLPALVRSGHRFNTEDISTTVQQQMHIRSECPVEAPSGGDCYSPPRWGLRHCGDHPPAAELRFRSPACGVSRCLEGGRGRLSGRFSGDSQDSERDDVVALFRWFVTMAGAVSAAPHCRATTAQGPAGLVLESNDDDVVSAVASRQRSSGSATRGGQGSPQAMPWHASAASALEGPGRRQTQDRIRSPSSAASRGASLPRATVGAHNLCSFLFPSGKLHKFCR
jgi:hypothetical protein